MLGGGRGSKYRSRYYLHHNSESYTHFIDEKPETQSSKSFFEADTATYWQNQDLKSSQNDCVDFFLFSLHSVQQPHGVGVGGWQGQETQTGSLHSFVLKHLKMKCMTPKWFSSHPSLTRAYVLIWPTFPNPFCRVGGLLGDLALNK